MVSLPLLALLALQAAPSVAPVLVAGDAVKVDLSRRQLIVRSPDRQRETVLDVDASRTRITAGGRPLALESVRPGEWVQAAYETAGAQRVAVLIEVGAPRPAPGPRR
jgi:hypothetical protein